VIDGMLSMILLTHSFVYNCMTLIRLSNVLATVAVCLALITWNFSWEIVRVWI